MMAFFGKFVSFAASEQPLTTGGKGSRVLIGGRQTHRSRQPADPGQLKD